MIDYTGFAFPKGSRALEKVERDRVDDRQERACRKRVNDRDGRRCFFPGCAQRASDKHHIRPRSLGGEWDPANIASACRKHHDWFKDGFIRVDGNPEKGPLKVIVTELGRKAKIRLGVAVSGQTPSISKGLSA